MVQEPFPVPAAGPLAEHARRIIEYYEGSWFDYRLLWLNQRSWAMHFGYELPGARSHRQGVLALNRVMAEAVELRTGARVLDAGCGVGGSAIWLAQTYGAEVTGVNIVPSHVARARRHVRSRRLANPPRIEVADYADTPLRDDSVDVVWAQESACHSPRKPAFLREAARVLAPGGRIVLAEYVLTTDTPSRAVDEWCGGWDMSLASHRTWEAWLQAAGFRDVVMRDETAGVRRSLRRLWRMCTACRLGGDVLHAVGLRSDAQQRNLYGGLAMWDALAAGDWRYALITAALPADAGTAARQGPAR